MTLTADLDAMFGFLLALVALTGVVVGNTFQWLLEEGILRFKLLEKRNQYNIMVFVASLTSLIHAVTNFVNFLMTPNNSVGFMAYIVTNWTFMTHFSILLVSRKLSMIYRDSERVWKRLVWVNVASLPLSIFVACIWTSEHAVYSGNNPTIHKINDIAEPIQIAIFGIIEFCLSSAFIVKMWQYKWTTIERKAIKILVLVGVCDIATIIFAIVFGDLEAATIKG